ncbi:hypothetical protein [Prevotella sp. 10(H)]|uniref:hypothetical protein n=1 Tax=Prevotella sp. 10(H) TaxID=1158294 RepID=UPI0004A6CE6E|nr:hypothetical protein [Prevotella sp. 10(H)]
MKFIKTTLWALCVCLFVACGDDDDNNGNGGNNGGDNGGGETPTEKVTLITELQVMEMDSDKKLPYLEFTYDDNNQLTKVVEYEHFENGTLEGATTMTFVRSGKLLTITSVSKTVAGEEDEDEAEKIEMKYDDNGNIIEKKIYNSDGTEDEVFQYTWANGKIVKVSKSEEGKPIADLYEVKRDADGNALPITVVYTESGQSFLNIDTDTYTLSVNKVKPERLYSLMPIEYSLIVSGDDGEGFLKAQSANEVTKFVSTWERKKYSDSDMTNLIGKTVSEHTNEYNYTYDANDLSTEFTESELSTYSIEDYIDDTNNSSSTKGPEVTKLYPTYVEKDKK